MKYKVVAIMLCIAFFGCTNMVKKDLSFFSTSLDSLEVSLDSMPNYSVASCDSVIQKNLEFYITHEAVDIDENYDMIISLRHGDIYRGKYAKRILIENLSLCRDRFDNTTDIRIDLIDKRSNKIYWWSRKSVWSLSNIKDSVIYIRLLSPSQQTSDKDYDIKFGAEFFYY